MSPGREEGQHKLSKATDYCSEQPWLHLPGEHWDTVQNSPQRDKKTGISHQVPCIIVWALFSELSVVMSSASPAYPHNIPALSHGQRRKLLLGVRCHYHEQKWWAVTQCGQGINAIYDTMVICEQSKRRKGKHFHIQSWHEFPSSLHPTSLWSRKPYIGIALSGSGLIVPPRAWQKEIQIYYKGRICHPRHDKSYPYILKEHCGGNFFLKKEQKRKRKNQVKEARWGKTCRNNKKEYLDSEGLEISDLNNRLCNN